MKRTAADLLARLQASRLRIFTTADLRTLTGQAPAAAVHALGRLEAQGLVARVRRGVWANRLAPALNPGEAVVHLRTPWPAYVSLHSALAIHGLVAEIPHATWAVTAAPPYRLESPLGAFRFHHLPSRLMWGYGMHRDGAAVYPLANPVKAFLDTMYLSLIPRSPVREPVRRGRRWDLDPAILRPAARRFAFPPLMRRLAALGFTA